MLPLAALLVGLAAGQADAWDDEPYDDDDDGRDRIVVTAWGGNAWETGERDGRSAALYGGELAWAFQSMDLGLAGYRYRLSGERHEWTPVALLRIVNRFQTGNGLEATFGFGLGAARPDDWVAWFQVALGARVNLGPMFVGAELAFERYDLLRLAGGVGARF